MSEEEEGFRADITMKEFLKKEWNMATNRLHTLYGNEGIIDVTRADLVDDERRSSFTAMMKIALETVAG